MESNLVSEDKYKNIKDEAGAIILSGTVIGIFTGGSSGFFWIMGALVTMTLRNAYYGFN